MGINDIILKYIIENELFDISLFSPISTMSRIILESRVPNFRDKIKNRFGLNNSFKLAYEFFSFLGDDYADYFVKRANSGDIYLRYFKKNNETAYSYPDENGCKKIYLPYGKDVCDCFTLVHEMMHAYLDGGGITLPEIEEPIVEYAMLNFFKDFDMTICAKAENHVKEKQQVLVKIGRLRKKVEKMVRYLQ